ncbi:MAG: mechanosensitive ion channel [Deltaproteobacteria bacterium]|nr:mechanosensitive ion channel [Deltaproteobacteria bacterium]
MEQVIGKLQEWIALYGLKVIAAIAILVIGRFAAIGVRALVRRVLEKSRLDATLVTFVASVSYVAMMAFIMIAALGQLGVQTASFVAVLGAAGLAVGLALQGSLANFAAGVLMMIFRPFKIGDYIEAGGTAGMVEEIGIFTTELKSPDNKKIILPNAKVTGDNIVNYSAKDQRRIDIVAGVSYHDDLDKVRTVLEQILSEDERILKDPAPTIGVLELADSSVNLAVRPWVQTADYWNVFFAVQEKIKKRFDAEGISIPFPQQDVYLHKTVE